jgi:hypothetical protein
MRTPVFLLFFLLLLSYSRSANKINYLDPVTNANLVSINNNIIIGFDEPIYLNESDILNSIKVIGSQSALHDGSIMICDNLKKIIFKPRVPYDYDEKVTVKITGKLLKVLNSSQKEFTYSFKTSLQKIDREAIRSLSDETSNLQIQGGYSNVPPQLPQITVTIDNNPTPGNIFLSNYHSSIIPAYLIITDMNGIPYWYKQIDGDCDDFKVQPNGHLTYYTVASASHYEMDTNYNIINTYMCGYGYYTDGHEFRLLNNGHAYVMAYDPETVNMQDSIVGGYHNATVVGLIIQEVDVNKNVFFQWRSWDHFSILDSWHQDLRASYIDYVHGNAIEIDNDSNLIISSRHLDEITKIKRQTGAIIWRFGGKNNQFAFLGDTLKFTYQHAIRRIPNGNLTLFDNGNYHNPPFSRAVEYNMDTAAKTATVVWEYRHNPAIYGSAMGNVQRLSSGNTLIGWGWTNPSVTEVRPDGTIAFEMTLPEGMVSYRAYKFEWDGAPTSIKDNSQGGPTSFQLNQNYPNPFNPTTKIKFSIPPGQFPLNKGGGDSRGLFVKLIIFDILGRSVATLVNKNLNPGSYEVEWNASSYASGVYFYKLETAGFSQIKKMILIK